MPENAEGRRKDSPAIFSKGSENKLIGQNKSGGFSGYGILFRRETTKL
ncbi:MAG: hypothetical protein IPI25_12125 [Candidatus Brocadia sp.]|nr:MAG: hypothetical protein IPI25_12125 [Candidatus Brocadia sp.]